MPISALKTARTPESISALVALPLRTFWRIWLPLGATGLAQCSELTWQLRGTADARQVDFEQFYDALAHTFGVPRERCINMYGMTELSTQLYDDGNAVVPSVKSGPHWIRSRLVDPLSGREVAHGERGVLVHCDLANFNSVTTILTEDVGIAADGGFLLLGRAEGAQAKGCSLAVQEFLQAARP